MSNQSAFVRPKREEAGVVQIGSPSRKKSDQALKSSSEESSEDASLEEVVGSEESGESIYEIEGVEQQEPDPAT
ncbi:hypothetical protein HUJ05_010675 [Dendroctonus ponderosae]|nr:hypothetical protein HUJ05_010675 [Dendroctonus ponderosae]